MAQEGYLLDIRKLSKSFGSTQANKEIDFQLKYGEVRGLAGENGSGKSTLLSQIAGIYSHDSGEMYLKGEPYQPDSPISANERRIAIVVQELGLVGALPAGINIFLGKTKKCSRFGMISQKAIQREVDVITAAWELPKISLNTRAGDLNIEHRKMVELVRALSIDPDILILDEVTQSLSQDNRKYLYGLIQKLKAQGRSVILISHDIEELIDITDTISVLRDGEILETVESAAIRPDELKQKMVGRKLEGDYYRSDPGPDHGDEVVLEVQGVSTESGLSDLSFSVHKGEILGFCGLSDSGIHNVGRLVYGLERICKGRVFLPGLNREIRRQWDGPKSRMGYAPKDRDTDALMMGASIRDNFVLSSLKELEGPVGFLGRKRLNRLAEEAREAYQVKCTGISQSMSELSGGNKQKVNLGRWLLKDLDLLVVDCPTRGVDVGVKAYLYQCLKEARKEGLGIVMITDELAEAIGMCDNIVVMKDQRIVKKIARGPGFQEETMIEVMI